MCHVPDWRGYSSLSSLAALHVLGLCWRCPSRAFLASPDLGNRELGSFGSPLSLLPARANPELEEAGQELSHLGLWREQPTGGISCWAGWDCMGCAEDAGGARMVQLPGAPRETAGAGKS